MTETRFFPLSKLQFFFKVWILIKRTNRGYSMWIGYDTSSSIFLVSKMLVSYVMYGLRCLNI